MVSTFRQETSSGNDDMNNEGWKVNQLIIRDFELIINVDCMSLHKLLQNLEDQVGNMETHEMAICFPNLWSAARHLGRIKVSHINSYKLLVSKAGLNPY